MDAPAAIALNQYLTFNLDDEIFALDIARVREVLEYAPVTALPRMPEFMRGVINLRGTVVPVVDLRLAFGMSRIGETVNTCVIIVEVATEDGPAVMGAVADSVQEVVELPRTEVEPAPRIGLRSRTRFIKGMGKHNGRFVIILDADTVFTDDEMARVHAARQGGGGDEMQTTA